MSSKFWASSEDLSIESSVDSSIDISAGRDVSRDNPNGTEPSEWWEEPPEESQDNNALTRSMAGGMSLPGLQPQQHANLFALSLIQDRCRTQAIKSINANRRQEDCLPEDHPEISELAQHIFAETRRDLLKAGIIPKELAGKNLPDLQLYLRSFDSLLNNIAARRTNQDISIQQEHKAIDGLSYSMSRDTSASFAYSRALVPHRSKLQKTMAQPPIDPSLLAFICLDNSITAYPQSVYAAEYQEIEHLGSGGEGSVVKAQYRLDKAEYAVKKVIIWADELEKLRMTSSSLAPKLKEIYALAALNHPNIVRYFHSWMEFRKAETRPNNLYSDSEGDSCDETKPDVVASVLTDFQNVHISERQLTQQHQTKPVDVDMVLYIRMKAYPWTLAGFLDHNASHDMIPGHCFHLLPTVRLLLVIINALQYIHRKNIIHQDLKPDNIFLSVLEAGELPSPSYVNITDCGDCAKSARSDSSPATPLYICPHIGDFGMIREVKDGAGSGDMAALEKEQESYKKGDSEMSGTPLYTPPVLGTKAIICPKRDVYSLGAIAFEMVYDFVSRTERAEKFSKARWGPEFPEEIRSHELGECIMGMMDRDRIQRWGLERAKEYLMNMEKRLVSG